MLQQLQWRLHLFDKWAVGDIPPRDTTLLIHTTNKTSVYTMYDHTMYDYSQIHDVVLTGLNVNLGLKGL